MKLMHETNLASRLAADLPLPACQMYSTRSSSHFGRSHLVKRGLLRKLGPVSGYLPQDFTSAFSKVGRTLEVAKIAVSRHHRCKE